MTDNKKKFATIEILEPRLLFSADAFAGALESNLTDDSAKDLLDMASTALDYQLNAKNDDPLESVAPPEPTVEQNDSSDPPPSFELLESRSTENDRLEVVFVDTSTPNYQDLLDDLLVNSSSVRQFDIVLIDYDTDGLQLITDTLSNYQDLDAIHIIAHGDDGVLELGESRLDAETLEENSTDIERWAEAFSEEGDILIYGCELAETELGKSLIYDLSEKTQTDVAASIDLTGHQSLGGDWALEFNIGSIEAEVAISESVQQQWTDSLDISSGLQVHQTYDAGQDAQDSSGNNRDGTLEDNAAIDTTPASNQIGDGKLTLDGTDDYVNVNAHASALAGYTEGTISAWINTSAASQQMIFNLGDTVASNFASLQIQGDGSLLWWVSEGGVTTVQATSSASFNDGNWHHVAVTVGPSGNSLWVDGTELTGGAISYSNGSAASTNFFDDLSGVARAEVGAYELSGTMYDEFNGLIDDFRVYDRALSAG
ncbi:MAG: DUF4347 domain-containing protein, partial [Gammaproteobacteria bacterium]|nr:DUF4347 domain-containing protein [Gammaproteobacteria bacterium]